MSCARFPMNMLRYWRNIAGETNMEEFVLVKPSEKYAEQILEYRREFIVAGNSMDGCGPIRRVKTAEEYLQICREYEDPATVPSHLVPATQFFFIRKSDDKLVGMIQVRHKLNDYLARFGGHIGYSVRLSERRKGYAKEMLRMTLPKCRELGLDKVMITCLEDNIGSEKTILANGGVYYSTEYEPIECENVKRFWILL